MKRHLIALVLIVAAGTLSSGSTQTARTDLFDAKKSQQELEVMRGILGTTLSFVTREMQGRSTGTAAREEGLVRSFGWGSNVNAFYLYGQGATFIVPMSRFSYGRLAGFDLGGSVDAMEEVQHELEAASASMEAQAAALAAEASSGYAQTPPPAPPAPPAPAAAPAPPAPPAPAVAAKPSRTPRAARNSEDYRKQLAEAQERVKERRQQSEQRRQKMLETVDQVKGYLVEAVANHGDSLTHVKPNEYINIVITTDGGDFFGGDGRREVISVQKSTITDYKAGRLSLDAFKQKVLQYSN